MASGDAYRMLPIVAKAFAELGYRRATTAALAKRCGVRENVLYRAWPSKKEMFLATIDHVWRRSMEIWQDLLAKSQARGANSAWLILDYEATHHGETGLYKLIFVGLTETNDRQIAAALRRMYESFHEFIARQIQLARDEKQSSPDPASQLSQDLAAWGILGLATVANIGLELKLFDAKKRGMLFTQLARLLIDPNQAGRGGSFK